MKSLSHKIISVIVPVYKVEPYLSKCIESIINQTYKDLDVILIDDGSPDTCGMICDEYAAKDSRIRVFHTENNGLSGARNYGIKKAVESNSYYIGFVDSDDWLEPEIFEVLEEMIEKTNADIAICGYYREYKNRKEVRSIPDKLFDNNLDLINSLIKGYLNNGVWNKLYKKSIFGEIEFPKGRVYEDIATTYKILANSTCVVSTSIPLYHYCQFREGSITRTVTIENLLDNFWAYKEKYEYFKQHSPYNTDKMLLERLLNKCANSVVKIWIKCAFLSKSERQQYGLQVKEINLFARYHFLLFGNVNWPFRLRALLFLIRYNSECFFSLLHCLVCLKRFISRT